MQRRHVVQTLLGLVVSIAALYLAVSGVDYASVWASLRQASLPLITLALLSTLINNLAKAVRWKILMGERGAQVRVGPALRLHLVGQLLNNLLPARIGDLSRAYMAAELGLSRSFALGTVAVEKVVDLIFYVLLFVLLLMLMPLPDWVSQPAYFMVVATTLTVVGLVSLFFLHRRPDPPPWMLNWLPLRLQARAGLVLHNLLASLYVLADSRQSLRIVAWSALIWLTAALTNAWTLQALAIEVPFVASLFLLFIMVAGINLPSAPARIGVFEYLCVLGLAVFGVPQDQALSFGVLLHVLVYLPMVLAGLATLRAPRQAALAADQVAPGPELAHERQTSPASEAEPQAETR